jgi:RNA polymerase sigma-70 factor (ECF subfamily)
MGDTDEEKYWVLRSRDGDHAAFEALVREHQQMVHSLTYRMTGSVDDCKDLAQETFVRAFQQLDTFQGTAKFSSWLYRIAVNACLDWRRREKRREQFLTNWAATQGGNPLQSNSSGIDGQASHDVQAALMKLPAKQRAAIVLTVYSEHTHAEAAKILNCSEATVSWRIFAARRKLKRLLRAKGGSNE